MEEKDSLFQQQENIKAVGELLRVVKDCYGDKINISITDPRDIFSVWDNVRYRVQMRPSIPAWILDRKKICDGIPDLRDLQRAIDEKLTSPANPNGA